MNVGFVVVLDSLRFHVLVNRLVRLLMLERVGLVGPSLVLLFCVLTGCEFQSAEKSDPTANVRPRVYAVNYPLSYFAERLGGDSVDVVIAGPVDPSGHWSPDDETIEAIQNANLVLLNGPGDGDWTQQISLSPWRIADTSRGIRDRLTTTSGVITHHHGPDGEHSHGEVASTIWLNPLLAIEQARVVAESLGELIPDQQLQIGERFEALQSDLETLDRELGTALKSDKEWLAFPGSYEYLGQAYSLELVPLSCDPAQPIDDSRWQKHSRTVGKSHAKQLLSSRALEHHDRQRWSDLGVRIVVFDTLHGRPSQGDYLSAMRNNINRLTVSESDGSPSSGQAFESP